MQLLLLTASTLLGGAAAARWTASAHGGLHCRGSRVAVYQSTAPDGVRECRNIDSPGFTSTMTLEVHEGAGSDYIFEFHNGQGCTSLPNQSGPVHLPPDGFHSCIRTHGAGSFSVTQSSRRTAALASEDAPGPADLVVRAPGELSSYLYKRDNLGYIMRQGSLALTAIATVVAACSPSLLLGSVGAAGCAFAAVIGAIETAIIGRNLAAVFRGRTPPGTDPTAPVRRAIDAPQTTDDQLYNLFNGFSSDPVSVHDDETASTRTYRSSAVASFARGSGDFIAFDCDITWDDLDIPEQSVHFEHDYESDVTGVSSAQEVEVANPLGRRGLEKRVENIVFHYAFDNGDAAAKARMPTDRGQINRLTNQAWQWMRQNNRGNACANLQMNGRSINRGYMQLSEGPFNDQRTSCPIG